MSVRSTLIGHILVLTGNHRRWASADAMRQSITARPPRKPTPRAPRGTKLTETTEDHWKILTLKPKGRAATGTLIYLHGGGYAFDMVSQQWSFLGDLVRNTGRRVIVPKYPLAPEGTAATTVPRVADIVAACAGQGPVSIGGDSAGAGLALAAALVLRDRGSGGIPLILLSPWVDVTMTDPDVPAAAARDPWLAPPGLIVTGDLYRGGLPATDPMVSPIYGDLTGLGAVIVTSGTHDVLNPDARRLVAALRAADVPVQYLEAEGLLHNYPLMPIPEAPPARRAIFATLGAPAS